MPSNGIWDMHVHYTCMMKWAPLPDPGTTGCSVRGFDCDHSQLMTFSCSPPHAGLERLGSTQVMTKLTVPYADPPEKCILPTQHPTSGHPITFNPIGVLTRSQHSESFNLYTDLSEKCTLPTASNIRLSHHFQTPHTQSTQ